VELGTTVEYFHASENAQPVRNRVFDIIKRNLAGVWVDILVVEKRKTYPALQMVEHFYPDMIGQLLRHILGQHDLNLFQAVIVFTDSLPIQKNRAAVEKAIKITLAKFLPATARYRLIHHDSKSNFDLQIAGYCTWALYRKWNNWDLRSYEYIQPVVRSEFDVFQAGKTFYY